MAESHPPLNITTQAKGEPVIIDGVEYHLTAFDDLSPADRYRLTQASSAALALQRDDETNEDGLRRLNGLVGLMFDLVVGDIPSDVQDRLSLGSKEQVVNAYFLAYHAHVMQRTGAEQKVISADGDGQKSPDSPEPTAATPSDG